MSLNVLHYTALAMLAVIVGLAAYDASAKPEDKLKLQEPIVRQILIGGVGR